MENVFLVRLSLNLVLDTPHVVQLRYCVVVLPPSVTTVSARMSVSVCPLNANYFILLVWLLFSFLFFLVLSRLFPPLESVALDVDNFASVGACLVMLGTAV